MKKILLFVFVFLISLIGVNAISVDSENFLNSSDTYTQAASSGTNTGYTMSGDVIHQGYFYQVTVNVPGGSTGGLITINKNSVAVASKTYTSTGGGVTTTFTLSDYSDTFEIDDTFDIIINPTGAETVYYSSGSHSGTGFEFAAQTTVGNGGSVGFKVIEDLNLVFDPSKISNSENISLNLNSTKDIDLSYSFNSSSMSSLCSSCNTSNIDFNNLKPNTNYSLIINLVSGAVDVNYTYNIQYDNLNPSLNVGLPSEYAYYEGFNFSQYINYSDENLDTCIVLITGESSTTCSDQNYNFTTNGNKYINIIVTDNANNINSSLNNLVLVTPYQYVYFNDELSTQIYNFTINGTLYENYFNPKVYDYGLGTHSFLFEKVGFNSTEFSLTFNNTSNINVTYNLPASYIEVHIYDRISGNYVTDNVTLEVIATFGDTATTTSGNHTFTNLDFISETYKITASSSSYTTEEIVFEYENKESKVVSLNMIPINATNAGVIRLIVIDESFQYVSGAICSLLEWQPLNNAFISIAQASSNENGQCYLNIELEDKFYQFSVTDGVNTKITESERIYIDSDSRTILLSGAATQTQAFNDIFSYIIKEGISGNSTTISFYTQNLNGLSQTSSLNLYKVIGNTKTLLNTTSNTGVITDFSETYIINNSYNIEIVGLVTYEGIEYEVQSFIYKSNTDISKELDKYGLTKFVIMGLLLLAVGLGLAVMVEVGLILMAVVIWGCSFMFPLIITGKVAVVVTVIIGIILWGVYKRK